MVVTTHWTCKVQLILSDTASVDFWNVMGIWLIEHIGNEGIKWRCYYVGYREWTFIFTNPRDKTLFALTWL